MLLCGAGSYDIRKSVDHRRTLSDKPLSHCAIPFCVPGIARYNTLLLQVIELFSSTVQSSFEGMRVPLGFLIRSFGEIESVPNTAGGRGHEFGRAGVAQFRNRGPLDLRGSGLD